MIGRHEIIFFTMLNELYQEEFSETFDIFCQFKCCLVDGIWKVIKGWMHISLLHQWCFHFLCAMNRISVWPNNHIRHLHMQLRIIVNFFVNRVVGYRFHDLMSSLIFQFNCLPSGTTWPFWHRIRGEIRLKYLHATVVMNPGLISYAHLNEHK